MTRITVVEQERLEKIRHLRWQAQQLRDAAVTCSDLGERTLAYELLVVSQEIAERALRIVNEANEANEANEGG
jgi:phosphopantetheine adenylyltransferase